MIKSICKICDSELFNFLKVHLKNDHNITLQQYVAKYSLGKTEDYIPTYLNKDYTNLVKFEENNRYIYINDF